MAKSVIINGVTYESVPYVNIPLSVGEGNAKFVDTDSGDAVAGDIRSGKKAWVDGAEVTGTIPTRTDSSVVISGKNIAVAPGIYDDVVEKTISDAVVNVIATVSGDVISDAVTSYPITCGGAATASTAGYISGTIQGTPFTRYIQVEEKTITPTTSAQDITPTSGKLLKKVHVNAVDVTATATEATVPAGVTFFAGSLTRRTGTATFPTVGQDSSTKVLTIQ